LATRGDAATHSDDDDGGGSTLGVGRPHGCRAHLLSCGRSPHSCPYAPAPLRYVCHHSPSVASHEYDNFSILRPWLREKKPRDGPCHVYI